MKGHPETRIASARRFPKRIMLCVATVFFGARIAEAHSVTFLDDAERIHQIAPLPKSVWGDGPITLDVLAGEVVAFQVVVDVGLNEDGADEPLLLTVRGEKTATRDPFDHALSAKVPPRHLHQFEGDNGAVAEVRVAIFSERFLDVKRPSGNEREPGSLSFTKEAAPEPSRFVGPLADPLVPGNRQPARGRSAFFVELSPLMPTPGVFKSEVVLSRGNVTLATRPLILHVGAVTLPYPKGKAFTYFDMDTLAKRGLGGAEMAARRILHAHALDGVTDLPSGQAKDPADEQAEADSLTGRLFAPQDAYESAELGAHDGSGTVVFGIYGAFKDPSVEKARTVRELAAKIREKSGAKFDDAVPFVYAIDEVCESPRIENWKRAFREASDVATPELWRFSRVGVTCSKPARSQKADVVFMTTDAFKPGRDDGTKDQFVGVYNGHRPNSGATVLDVPATDLLANGWIAAKYNIWKWFYWESTFWLDGNRGGRGGKDGFDPLVVAETFHNADGDYQNGDGILLYPGSQVGGGMTDLGFANTLLPSLRLKMIRRGLLDGELIRLAREKDAARTEGIVDALVPLALADAKVGPSWPSRGADWFFARKALHEIIEGGRPSFSRTEPRVLEPPSGAVDRPIRIRTKALAVLLMLTLAALAAWARFRAPKQRA